MAMNNKLLRPRASGYTATDADARTYIAAVESADKQKLEKAVAVAINDFVVGCKADGIWSAIKASCILMGARTLSGALTPLVGTAPTNNNFVSGDYNRKTGLLGNGSTKYINTLRAESADPQNNHHIAVYASTVGSGNMLANGSATTVISSSATRSRSSTSDSYTAAAGFIGVSRSASDAYSRLNGGSTTSVTRTSQGSVADTFFAVAGTPRLAFYSLGTSLDLSLLGARVSALYTAIGAAIL
jgi:hypothetical protein